MKTTLSLSTKQSTSSSICKSCKRELPLESFYMNKKTQSPDKYCKEDRETRLRLILHALQVVRLSMERKKAGMQEESLL